MDRGGAGGGLLPRDDDQAGGQGRYRLDQQDEAEVADVRLAVVVDQDVGRLEVAVE
jgi:hypothetical protein